MEGIIVLLYTLAILLVISITVSAYTLASIKDILDELKKIPNTLKRMEDK